MAKLNPVENLCFDKPTEWTDWKRLNKETGGVQVNSLIYALGSEAENVFKSFTIAAENEKIVIDKQNVIHERACFYQRVQRG